MYCKAKEMLQKARQPKHGGWVDWGADFSVWRTCIGRSLLYCNRRGKNCNEKCWVRVQGRVNQRPDFVEAKREMKRLHDEHVKETSKGNTPIHPVQRSTQWRNQQFEELEEYDYQVDPQTGWRSYPSKSQENLRHPTSSSSSTQWEQHDDWKSKSAKRCGTISRPGSGKCTVVSTTSPCGSAASSRTLRPFALSVVRVPGSDLVLTCSQTLMGSFRVADIEGTVLTSDIFVSSAGNLRDVYQRWVTPPWGWCFGEWPEARVGVQTRQCGEFFILWVRFGAERPAQRHERRAADCELSQSVVLGCCFCPVRSVSVLCLRLLRAIFHSQSRRSLCTWSLFQCIRVGSRSERWKRAHKMQYGSHTQADLRQRESTCAVAVLRDGTFRCREMVGWKKKLAMQKPSNGPRFHPHWEMHTKLESRRKRFLKNTKVANNFVNNGNSFIKGVLALSEKCRTAPSWHCDASGLPDRSLLITILLQPDHHITSHRLKFSLCRKPCRIRAIVV